MKTPKTPKTKRPKLSETFLRFHPFVAECRGGELCLFSETGTAVTEYCIEYSRLDTAEKAVEWVRHLTEKAWIRPEHFKALIDVAIQLGARCDYNC